MSANPQRRILDIAAAAEYLCVGVKVVKRYVREGRLPRVMLSQKRYLFDLADLDRLIESEKAEISAPKIAPTHGPKRASNGKQKPYEWAEKYGVRR